MSKSLVIVESPAKASTSFALFWKMNIQRKIVVRGKVQGVGFRNAFWRKAMELGIRGSVRNLDDGSVEIMASATDKEFKVFENWCREGRSHQGGTALKFLN